MVLQSRPLRVESALGGFVSRELAFRPSDKVGKIERPFIRSTAKDCNELCSRVLANPHSPLGATCDEPPKYLLAKIEEDRCLTARPLAQERALVYEHYPHPFT